jgi:hypothetical protein
VDCRALFKTKSVDSAFWEPGLAEAPWGLPGPMTLGMTNQVSCGWYVANEKVAGCKGNVNWLCFALKDCYYASAQVSRERVPGEGNQLGVTELGGKKRPVEITDVLGKGSIHVMDTIHKKKFRKHPMENWNFWG